MFRRILDLFTKKRNNKDMAQLSDLTSPEYEESSSFKSSQYSKMQAYAQQLRKDKYGSEEEYQKNEAERKEMGRILDTRRFCHQILAENWEMPDSSKKLYEDLIADCDSRLALKRLKN